MLQSISNLQWRVNMTKQYFYEFIGRILIQADNQQDAESAVTGIILSDYLINEDLYQVDESYVSNDLKIREKQFGTIHHPLNDPDAFEEYKRRFHLYNHIFNDFLNGKIDRQELTKRMVDPETERLDDCGLSAEISMVDLEAKKSRTARLVSVD